MTDKPPISMGRLPRVSGIQTRKVVEVQFSCGQIHCHETGTRIAYTAETATAVLFARGWVTYRRHFQTPMHWIVKCPKCAALTEETES